MAGPRTWRSPSSVAWYVTVAAPTSSKPLLFGTTVAVTVSFSPLQGASLPSHSAIKGVAESSCRVHGRQDRLAGAWTHAAIRSNVKPIGSLTVNESSSVGSVIFTSKAVLVPTL